MIKNFKPILNRHLEPVFNILLPQLETAKVDYWVYGGVSIAAYVGMFIRFNKDVDSFVREEDFGKARSILDVLCKQRGFQLEFHKEKSNEKPKIEIYNDSEEILSVIPVYQQNNFILFKYSNGNEKYSDRILEKAERDLSGYRFFTSQDKFIKEKFINHIISRPGKKEKDKYKKDAMAILSPEELTRMNWPLNQSL